MKLIIILELFINYILLTLFNTHMLQLNSYFFRKHFKWMRKNWKKILIQTILILPTVIICINNKILNSVLIIILGISILYNMPKRNSKISLKFTGRVKRLLVTDILVFNILMSILGIKNYITEKLIILNICSNIIILLANFINSPIEFLVRKRYIDSAKKILNEMPNLLVIGITGSYGKTSMKNFLYSVLSEKYEVLKTPKNYNTTMGVVKTIREELKPTHQIFLCEMGATKLGDIKEICDIVNPKLGVITSIGPQHLESFKNIENVIKTKFELADSVEKNGGTIFLNYDNEFIKNKSLNMKKITYGLNNKELDYNSYNLESSSKGLKFKTVDKNKEEVKELKTKLIGKHNIVNITGAIAVADFLGVPSKKIVSKIREIQNVKHRLELVPKGPVTIIDDSYNANPISSKSAIDTLSEFKGVKIIVTPGLIELGKEQEKYNYEFGKYMARVCDYIFLVGTDNYEAMLKGIKEENYKEENIFKVNLPQEAVSKILEWKLQEEVIVLLENDLPDNYNL